ncbi:MAG: pyridoxal-phosphate dependent enzyme [Ardenticatenaceae bacterium]|nr:pyridoxal-phosphate dependent enzyme [Anaerolineales bacterium]MCB8920132.1 pyridoxal-phosphate dependent enzyme [Ardenticatenaceae bacterium]MCB8992194.1 pyridoxal-phosphate dependent enzyme [Ardenticatenaceae bacterium]MCB9005075.1 pyridoxal-phosphate dependent enzyme [Ardenticatenaceae bacterium]
MSDLLPTAVSIYQAHTRIRPYISAVPLRRSSYLSDLTGADVWLKLENLQPTGSFKVRGALHKIARLTAVQKARGIVTASAGNHGLGVAYAVQTWGGVRADIFVPSNAPQTKVRKLRRFPITLHQTGDSYEAAHEAAAVFAAQTGALEISAYDDADVIAGQGTIGLEIVQERPQVDSILVPVGGGGMLAGITVALKTLHPACEIVGVQPQASPAALLSFQDDVAYDPYNHEPTLADGLAGGFGRLPFALTRGRVQVELASEAELRRAIYMLLTEEQLLIEPSGAISIVPLLRGGQDWQGKTVICVLSGGNLDVALLRTIINEVAHE